MTGESRPRYSALQSLGVNGACGGAFFFAVPVVWNNTPHSLKAADTVGSFKVKLKTHFYSLIYVYTITQARLKGSIIGLLTMRTR